MLTFWARAEKVNLRRDRVSVVFCPGWPERGGGVNFLAGFFIYFGYNKISNMTNLQKKKILLIEDEKILGEMYQEKFTEAGFKVFWVIESQEGLELAKKERPDLIVLDILLPREDGIFFLEELRKDQEISSIPVVAFSNYDAPEARKQAKELGILDYLLKTDYTPQEVVEKIKSYLE